jgi:hypothetical protein
MEAGYLVERGGHSELLAANGAYARLWRQEASETTPAPHQLAFGRVNQKRLRRPPVRPP